MCALAKDDPLKIQGYLSMPLFGYFSILNRRRDESEKRIQENAREKQKSAAAKRPGR